MLIPEKRFSQIKLLYIYIYIYIYLYLYTLAISPSLGGSRQHKRTTKTMGTPLRSYSNGEGPSRVWMALLEQHSPSSPVFHNLRRFTDAISPTAPTTQGCPYKATPWQRQMPIRTASQSFGTHSYSWHAHLPPLYPFSYHSGLSLLHPSTQT